MDAAVIANAAAVGFVEDLTNKLTHDCLLKLFSLLPRDDIVTMQRVCHSWRIAALDKYLWNNYTLTLSGKPEELRKLIIMPALRNITGHTGNHLLNVILDYTMELKQLKCDFLPAMSPSQAERLLDKYPQLETVKVNIYAPNAAETIDKLKTGMFLKEIIFSGGHFIDFDFVKYFLSLQRILLIFSDCQYFPSLSKLDLSKQFWTRAFENVLSSNVMAFAIKKRSQQILSLKVGYDSLTNAPVLNSVGMCSRLKSLSLSFFSDSSASLNIDKLSELQSLHIFMNPSCGKFWPEMVRSLFTTGSWTYLTEVIISLCPSCEVHILSTLIENAKQLVILKYIDDSDMMSENQLEAIGSLQKLEILTVHHLKKISEKGINYLSNSRNLVYLSVSVRSTDIQDFTACYTKMLCLMGRLTTFKMIFQCWGVNNFNLLSRKEVDEFLKATSQIQLLEQLQ